VEIGLLVTYIKLSTIFHLIIKEQSLDDYEYKDLEEILRIILKIKNPELTKNFEINHNTSFKGLQKYSCETMFYTCNNTFYLQPPQYSRKNEFEFIDVGFLDIKNHIFYELGLLLQDHYFEKNLFFEEWIAFLQILIDKKIYSKLFETFSKNNSLNFSIIGFNKGIYKKGDRLIQDDNVTNLFQKSLKAYLGDDTISCDFSYYLCDLMKTNSNLISYSILKKKISSNLKNFKDTKFFQTSDKFGNTSLSKIK